MTNVFLVLPEPDEALDLLKWLAVDDDLSQLRVELLRNPVPEGHMGGLGDTIRAIAEPDNMILALISGVLTWLTTRRPNIKVRLRIDDREVEVEAQRPRDVERLARAAFEALTKGDT